MKNYFVLTILCLSFQLTYGCLITIENDVQGQIHVLDSTTEPPTVVEIDIKQTREIGTGEQRGDMYVAFEQNPVTIWHLKQIACSATHHIPIKGSEILNNLTNSPYKNLFEITIGKKEDVQPKRSV